LAPLLLADAAAEHAGPGHCGPARVRPGARVLHHARSPRRLARDHAGDGDRDSGRRPAGLELGLGRGHGAAGTDRRPGGGLRPAGRAGPGVGLMSERTSWLVWGVTGPVMAFLAAPSLLVIAMSFSGSRFLEFPPRTLSMRWYEAYWSSAAWWNATVRSLQIGVMVTVLATTLGTLASIALVRLAVPGKSALRALIVSPIVVPTIVLSIGLYNVYSRWRLIGSAAGLVLAHTVLALPFVVLNVS